MITGYVKILILFFLAAITFSTFLNAREWTNKDGKKIEAELISKNVDSITIKKNDKEFTIKLSNLSDADQEFLKGIELTKPSKTYFVDYEFLGEPFKHGGTRVKVRKKDGTLYHALINNKGKVVTPSNIDVISDLVKGKALVTIDGVRGVIDNKGKIIWKNTDLTNVSFLGDIIYGDTKNKQAFYTLEGKSVPDGVKIETLFSSNGLFCASKNGKFGFVDEKGNVKIDFNYASVEPFWRGIAIVSLIDKEGGKKGRKYNPNRSYDFSSKSYRTGFYINTKGEKVSYKKRENIVDGEKFYEGTFKSDYNGVSMYKKGFINEDWIYYFHNEQNLRRPNRKGIPYHYSPVFNEGLMPKIDYSGEFKKYGYVDSDNKWVIKPTYDFVENFSDGLAFVMKGGEKFFIDKYEKKVFSLDCRSALSFKNGYARYEANPVGTGHSWRKCGVVNKVGGVVIPPIYEKIGSLNEDGVTVATIRRKVFIVSVDSEPVDITKYCTISFPRVRYIRSSKEEAVTFKSKLLMVRTENGSGYLNYAGEMVIPDKYTDARPFSGDIALVKEGEKWGAINTSGEVVVPFIWNSIDDPNPRYKNGSKGFVSFYSKGHKVYRNLEGSTLPSAYSFRSTTRSESGYIQVSNAENKLGFMNGDGVVVIDTKYSRLENFVNGYAKATVHRDELPLGAPSKIVYINEQGREFTEAEYYTATNQLVEKTDGFYDVDGQKIITKKEGEHYIGYGLDRRKFLEGNMIFTKESRYGVYNYQGKVIVPPKYKSISAFRNGFAIFKDVDDKYGVIDRSGKVVIKAQFESIGSFSEGLAYAKFKNKVGYINTVGKLVIGFR